MNPKISVIIPVFNVERYIKQCLDSLLGQTLKDIEIILIDDCSPDKCGTICDEFANKDNRVRVIHNEINIGSGYSRNKGIDMASGEYVAFVDPDDWVDLDFYEKLYAKAITDDFDIIKAERKTIFSHKIKKKELESRLNDLIRENLKKVPLYLLFTHEHTTAIYKKSLLLESEARYPNIRNSQDDVFLLMITYHCKKIGFVKNIFYNYRIHSESAIHKTDEIYYFSHIKKIEYEIEFLNSKVIDEKTFKMFFFIKLMRIINNLSRALSNNQIDSIKGKNSFYEFIEIIRKSKHKIFVTKNIDIDLMKKASNTEQKWIFRNILFDLSEQIVREIKSYKMDESSVNLIYHKYYNIRRNLLVKKGTTLIKKEILEILILLKMFIKFKEIIKYRMFWYFLIFKHILKYEEN